MNNKSKEKKRGKTSDLRSLMNVSSELDIHSGLFYYFFFFFLFRARRHSNKLPSSEKHGRRLNSSGRNGRQEWKGKN